MHDSKPETFPIPSGKISLLFLFRALRCPETSLPEVINKENKIKTKNPQVLGSGA
jgi:hypothetical protein